MPSSLRPHPEERHLCRVSKDVRHGALMVRDGAIAPPHHEEQRAFHDAEYSTGIYLLRFQATGRMLVRNIKKFQGNAKPCPPRHRYPARATPKPQKPMMSSWSAPVLPACTCCIGCASRDCRSGSTSRAAMSGVPGTGTAIPARVAISKA